MSPGSAKGVTVLSLTLNGILLATICWLLVFRAANSRQMIARPLRPTVSVTNDLSPLPGPAPTVVSTAPRSIWEALDSKNPRDLIAHLRSVGCPEQTIRELITFRLSRQYHQRLLGFEDAHFANLRYWEPSNPAYFLERSKLNTELRNERNAALEELFGEDAGKILRTLAGHREREGRYDFLPAAKRKALAELEQRFNSLVNEIRFGRGVYIKSTEGDPVAQKEMEELKRQRRSETEQLLSASELFELDLRESPAADYVRRESPEARSEEEFRNMVKAVLDTGLVQKSQSEERRARYASGDPDELAERNQRERERQKILEEKIKDVVGGERIEEMDRQSFEREFEEGRTRFRSELATLGEGLQIEDATMDRLIEQFKPVLHEQRVKSRGNPGESEQRALEESIKAQLDKRILETLGDAGPEFLDRWNRKIEESRRK